MNKKIKKRTALDAVSMSIANIPTITSHSNLPYVSEAVYLGKVYK